MRLFSLVVALAGALALGPALADNHLTEEDKMAAAKALETFVAQDAGMQALLDKSVGYAVYPSVGKAGFVLGGSHGRGVAYQGGEVVGGTKLSSIKFGLVAGVATFSQLMLFDTEEAWNLFKEGQFVAGADAGAVAMKSGGAGAATYTDGIAIFITDQEGVMGDISVAGEKFSFEPM